MADISQITLPSNQVLNIKDSTARQGLSTKVDIAQGSANANKYLATDSNGNIIVQELPTASSTVLGAVKPVTKTVDMTQAVGVDANGLLYTNASAQSDWNENDSTDPAYIQNRTHYVGDPVDTQVWSQTVTFNNSSSVESQLEDYLWTNNLEDGQAYSVVYNGTTYTGNVFYVSQADIYAIGNLHLGSEDYDDTGESFLISCVKNNSSIVLILSEEYTGDVSIALTLTIALIHKLDSKFLNGKLITEGTGFNSEIFNEVSLNIASGDYSHAEGYQTSAEGEGSHAEGAVTNASANGSHAEGVYTTATGSDSHAEGNSTNASGSHSHAEGENTNASSVGSHAEGSYTNASGGRSHAEGSYTNASGSYSHTEGHWTNAIGIGSHAEGGDFTLSDNALNVVLTGDANAIIYTVSSNSTYPWRNLIDFYIGDREHQVINQIIENGIVTTIGLNQTLSSSSISRKTYSVVKGNIAFGTNAHTEGDMTIAHSSNAHAEGARTTALEEASHSEGYNTIASSKYSHAEGNNTIASGQSSHAEGNYTTANHKSQHVFGEYNVEDPSTAAVTARGNYVEIVGKGTSTSARSNARTLDWSGNEVLAGKLTVGTGPTANMDVATKQYVDAATAGISPNLSGLSDTNISSPADGQVLKYDSTSSKWVNGDAEDTIYVTITSATENEVTTYSADKTYADLKEAHLENKNIILKYLIYNFYLWSGPKTASSATTFTFGTLVGGNEYYFTINNSNIVTKHTLQAVKSVNGQTGVISLGITDATDTTISSPATGQILTYDGTTSKWVNTTSPYMTASQVNELITAALAEYGDGDTASYGFEDASEVSY